MAFRNIVLPEEGTANPIESEATNQVPERGYFSTIEVGAGSKTFKMAGIVTGKQIGRAHV